MTGHLSILHTVAGSIFVLIVLSATRWVLSTLRPKAYPPGPPVTPGLGNLLQIPVQKPYLQFHKWAKQYGDMVGLKTGAGNLVVLNTPALVYELFDKRGAICSDRPVSHVMTEHVFNEPDEKALLILQYDKYYQRWRKSFQYILSTAGIKRMLPLLEAEASSLIRKLLDGGKDYENHLRHWSLAVPLVAVSGERLDDLPPSYADSVFYAQEVMLELLVPGSAPLVDIFPILKYVPASWRKQARHAREMLMKDAHNYLEGGRKQFKQLQQKPGSVKFESLLGKIMQGSRSRVIPVAKASISTTRRCPSSARVLWGLPWIPRLLL